MSQLASITVKDLIVTRSKSPILNSISFSVQPKRLIGLIGPSGSGKTTLMRCLVGVQTVTTGDVTVLGVKAGSPSLRGNIGYVSQSPAIYSDLTVEQNLRYFASLYGVEARQIEAIILDVDLLDQRNQLVETLSGGQKARVSLAVALLHSPEVLVLDEPTVGLDPVLRKQLWEMFRNLAEQGKTIIISSHVMDEAERCDELLLLRDGKLLWQGENAQLLAITETKTIENAFLKLIEEAKS